MKVSEHWKGSSGSFGFIGVGSAARLLGRTCDDVRTLVQKGTIEEYQWFTGDIVLNALHVNHLTLFPELLERLLGPNRA